MNLELSIPLNEKHLESEKPEQVVLDYSTVFDKITFHVSPENYSEWMGKFEGYGEDTDLHLHFSDYLPFTCEDKDKANKMKSLHTLPSDEADYVVSAQINQEIPDLEKLDKEIYFDDTLDLIIVKARLFEEYPLFRQWSKLYRIEDDSLKEAFLRVLDEYGLNYEEI